MDRAMAEVLFLTMDALGTGILMFVAGVVQKIMDDMSELDFKRFLPMLDHRAMADPFAVTIATVPIIATVVYFVAYGFGHWFFTAGIVAWLVGGTVTKVSNMPVYQWVEDPTHTDPTELGKQRRKLHLANNTRAWISLLSVLLMACQFSVLATAVVTAGAALLVFPLLLLARQYSPSRKPGVIST